MTTPRSRIIAVSEVAWQDRGEGLRMKSLWDHPESKRRAVLTRIEPGAKLPLHRHDGEITSGNMGYRPNGCVHTVESPNGATLLAILTGGVEPVAHRTGGPPSQVLALSELPWIEARPGVCQKRIWEDADESGVVATGNMNYRPQGCVHTVTTQNGATVLAVVWGHTEPV